MYPPWSPAASQHRAPPLAFPAACSQPESETDQNPRSSTPTPKYRGAHRSSTEYMLLCVGAKCSTIHGPDPDRRRFPRLVALCPRANKGHARHVLELDTPRVRYDAPRYQIARRTLGAIKIPVSRADEVQLHVEIFRFAPERSFSQWILEQEVK